MATAAANDPKQQPGGWLAPVDHGGITMSFPILRSATILLAILLLGSVAGGHAEEGATTELQSRVDRLERAVAELQAQVGDLQAGSAKQSVPGYGSLDDPLLGTWQCTNNVFTYNMTFLNNGQLLQETPTFGPMRELSWTRLSDFEILLTGGIKLLTRFRSSEEMTVDNQNNQAKWECRKQVKP